MNREDQQRRSEERKEQKTVKLTHGYATVDIDCSPETIEALDNLSKVAYEKLNKKK
jgi:hypothetical protein